MIKPLLFLFLGLQQNNGATSVDVGQVRQEVQQVQRQLGDVKQSVDQVRTQLREIAMCSAEVRWLSLGTQAVDAQKATPLSVLSTISQPADSCLSAELKITANFYDQRGMFVCGGSVSVPQTALVQQILFEIQPLNLEYFIKWRDGQSWERSNFHRLTCYDYDLVENRDPGSQSSSVKLFATVLPKRGGVATADMALTLPAQAVVPRRPTVIPTF
jgi:hypothetical protein